MNLLKLKLLSSLCLIFLLSCNSEKEQKIMAWKPVYLQDLPPFTPFYSAEIHQMEKAGKIFVLGTRLYQVDINKGVFISNIEQPDAPSFIGFVAIPGVSDLTVKSGLMYANYYTHLITLDISNLENIQLVNIQKDAFDFHPVITPPEKGFFECVNHKNGFVVDWIKTEITNPKCRY